jgi:hypothetical protein
MSHGRGVGEPLRGTDRLARSARERQAGGS